MSAPDGTVASRAAAAPAATPEELHDGVDEHAGIDPAAAAAPAESPYGEMGQPFDRRSPFYYGFVGALGALSAFWLFKAVAGIGSVLLLVVVSFFLAA